MAALGDVSAWSAVAMTVAVGAGMATAVVTGLGFSLVAAPVMVLVLGPAHGVRLNNMLSVAVSASVGLTHRDGLRWRDAGRLLVPGIAVTPAAAWAAHRTDATVLGIVAGTVTVATAAILARGVRSRHLVGTGGLLSAGGISGTMNVLSGLSGPPVAMYAINAGWHPDELRSTLSVYFLGLNVAAVGALGPLSVPVPMATGLVAALVVGWLVGRAVSGHLAVERVRAAVLGVASLGGVAAVVRALV